MAAILLSCNSDKDFWLSLIFFTSEDISLDFSVKSWFWLLEMAVEILSETISSNSALSIFKIDNRPSLQQVDKRFCVLLTVWKPP